MKYQEWLLTVRSKNTHKLHSFSIRCFSDEILSTVASQQAEKLGANVEGIELRRDWADMDEEGQSGAEA